MEYRKTLWVLISSVKYSLKYDPGAQAEGFLLLDTYRKTSSISRTKFQNLNVLYPHAVVFAQSIESRC